MFKKLTTQFFSNERIYLTISYSFNTHNKIVLVKLTVMNKHVTIQNSLLLLKIVT